MTRARGAALLALALPLLGALAGGARAWELPAAPGAEVILYEPGASAAPTLRIRADGSATLGDARRARLAPGELEALLDDLLVRGRFFELEGERIAADVRAAQRRSGTVVASDGGRATRIRVRLAEREHELRFAGLEPLARAHPEVASLQRLRDLARRLDRALERLSARAETR